MIVLKCSESILDPELPANPLRFRPIASSEWTFRLGPDFAVKSVKAIMKIHCNGRDYHSLSWLSYLFLFLILPTYISVSISYLYLYLYIMYTYSTHTWFITIFTSNLDRSGQGNAGETPSSQLTSRLQWSIRLPHSWLPSGLKRWDLGMSLKSRWNMLTPGWHHKLNELWRALPSGLPYKLPYTGP